MEKRQGNTKMAYFSSNGNSGNLNKETKKVPVCIANFKQTFKPSNKNRRNESNKLVNN